MAGEVGSGFKGSALKRKAPGVQGGTLKGNRQSRGIPLHSPPHPPTPALPPRPARLSTNLLRVSAYPGTPATWLWQWTTPQGPGTAPDSP